MNRSQARVSTSARAHRLGRHRLAERDGRGLDETAAARCSAAQFVACEGCEHVRDLVARRAIEAMGVGRVAVQLDDCVLGDARVLMQPVDVLGDDGGDLAASHQRLDGAVAAIGLGLAEDRLALEPPPPGLAPRLVARRGSPGSRSAPACVQMPPGLRKSGMPDSVLMPAPVKTTARRDRSSRLDKPRSSASRRKDMPPLIASGGLAGRAVKLGL